MNFELQEPTRNEAIAPLCQYFEQNARAHRRPCRWSSPGYFLNKVGPVIYNKATADAQKGMEQRVADLPGECSEEEFQYSPRASAKQKRS